MGVVFFRIFVLNMKPTRTLPVQALLVFGLLSAGLHAQSVGIGTATPHPSARLHIEDNARGLLIPNVALNGTNDVTTVSSPATSLLVYNTNPAGTGATAVSPGFYYWDGTKWVRLMDMSKDGPAWLLTGNAGTNPAVNFIGTTDAQPLVIRTNNTERMRVTETGRVGIGTTTPEAKLDVAGAIYQSAPDPTTILFHSTNESGNPSNDGFRIRYDGDFYGPYGDALILEKTDGNQADPDGGISFVNTGNDGVVEPTLTIRGNGNVGIGTTTPGVKLDVYGGSGTYIRVSGAMPEGDGTPGLIGYELRNLSAGGYWRMYLADPDGGFGVIPRSFEIWEYPADLGTGTCCRPRLKILSSNGLADPTQVVIDPLGNVGIGTTAASNKLVVGSDLTGASLVPANTIAIGAANTSSDAVLQVGESPTAKGFLKWFGGGNYFAVGTADAAYPLVLQEAANAYVGIGTTTPTYKLHVVGAVYATGVVYCNGNALCSDQRWKTNIKPIQNALDNVLKMQGVTYYWKVDEYPDKHFPEGEQIGFIAQEIEKVYPQLVLTDKDGYKSIDYSKLTPILVEAIKEQQKIIEELQKVIQQLQEENSQIKQANAQLSAEIKMLNDKVDNLINSLSNNKKLGYR
jgi:hypothetical protein